MTKRWTALALFALAVMLVIYGLLRLVDLAHSQTVVDCVSAKEQARIRELTVSAIDEAFKDHVNHLFTIWTKDQSQQPKRAMSGMEIGISAYQRAHANAMQWSPPACEEK